MTDTVRLTAALAGRYTIERELGAGGMASVYLAQDLKHQRRVAIKVLRPELAAAIGSDRFLREITTTANLRHPHILPLYDSGAVSDTSRSANPCGRSPKNHTRCWGFATTGWSRRRASPLRLTQVPSPRRATTRSRPSAFGSTRRSTC